VAKQKWFQHSHRANIVSHWIIEVSKTKPFIFVLGITIGVICISIYDNYQVELAAAKNQRIIDSLNVEISVKSRESDELFKKAEKLDSLLKNQQSDVTNIINNFPSQQRPEIRNSDSAAKFVLDFIRK
jgi:hypothetical protein